MQFVPLWTSILRSRKVAALPDDLYRTWTLCLLTAQEHDHKHGSLPDVDDFSYALHTDVTSLVSRLSRLVTTRFLDLRDGIYYVHDWDDWKHRPDPTGAARKRAQRDREREEKEAANGVASSNGDGHESSEVTVTSVTSQKSQCHAPTHLTSPTPQQHTPLPPGGGPDEWVCEEIEPFQSDIPEPPPIDLPPDKLRVLNRQAQRFGASNGDRIIADLLRDYSAAIVTAACDQHHAKNNGVLYPPKLAGICRSMQAGTWKITSGNAGGAVDYRPTPVVATPSPTSKFAPTPNYAPGEVAKILGLKEHDA